MLEKIKNFFFVISIIIFLYTIFNLYFSDQNRKKTIKNRTMNNIENLYISNKNIPILKSDTDNVIEYKSHNKIIKKKRKFWKLLLDN